MHLRSCSPILLIALVCTAGASGCVGSIGGGGQAVAGGRTIFVDEKNSTGMEDGTEEHPYTSAQNALANAGKGDVIHIAAGTYVGLLELKDGVSLIGAGAKKTIIDAGGDDKVIFAKQFITSETLLEGMTFTGAVASFGAVFIQGTPVIRDCIITGNSAATSDDDTGDDTGDDSGAKDLSLTPSAVRFGSTDGMVMTRCLIVDNAMTGFNNVFPVGVNELVDCLIACNDGDGVATMGRRDTLDKDFRMTNCTVALNTGDGLYIDGSADLEVYSTVFWGNGGVAVRESENAGDPELFYNDVHGSYYDTDTGSLVDAADLINALDPPGTNKGNIVALPRFTDDEVPDLDFVPQEGSRLINRGDPAAESVDRDGSRNDIGATGGPEGTDDLTCTGSVIAGLGFFVRYGPDPNLAELLVAGGAQGQAGSRTPRGRDGADLLVDLTGDGQPDRLVVDDGNRLWLEEAGRDGGSRRTRLGDGDLRVVDGLLLVDFDLDGALDLHLPGGLPGPRDALLHNEGGGRFREVSRAVGLCIDSLGRARGWADIDGNGAEDLIVSAGADGLRAFLAEGVPGRSLRVIPGPQRTITAIRIDLDGNGDFAAPPAGHLALRPAAGVAPVVIGLGGAPEVVVELLLDDGTRRVHHGVRPGSTIIGP